MGGEGASREAKVAAGRLGRDRAVSAGQQTRPGTSKWGEIPPKKRGVCAEPSP